MPAIGNLFKVGQSTGGDWLSLDEATGGRVACLDGPGNHCLLSFYGEGHPKLVSLADTFPVPMAVRDAAFHVGFVETVGTRGGGSIGRTKLGAVYTWGVTGEGQRGTFRAPAHDPTLVEEPTLVERLGVGVVSVGAGRGHFAAVTAEGLAYTWGCDEKGQLGLAPTTSRGRHLQVFGDLCTPGAMERPGAGEYAGVPRCLASLAHLKLGAVACGEDWSLFLTRGGEVYACGAGGCGQLGVGRVTSLFNPVKVTLDKALEEAREQGEGSASSGTPQQDLESVSTKVASLCAGASHALVVTHSGHVFTWGFNAHGQLGLGDLATRFTPALVREELGGGSSTGSSSGGGQFVQQQQQGLDSPQTHREGEGGMEEEEEGKEGKENGSEGGGKGGNGSGSGSGSGDGKHWRPVVVSKVAAGTSHSVLLCRDGRVLSYGCAEGGRLGHSYSAAPGAEAVAVMPAGGGSGSSMLGGVLNSNALDGGPSSPTATLLGLPPPPVQLLKQQGRLPPSRCATKWLFSKFGLGPLAQPSANSSSSSSSSMSGVPLKPHTPYCDPPHMLRNAASGAAGAQVEAGGRGAAAAAGGVEEGTWRLPLTRTLSHTLMRAQGRANAQEKSRGVLLAAAGLPPTTTPTDEPALIAHNVMMKLPAVTHQDGLGKPWLRTPKATPSSPPVTLPTLVTHPLLQSRVVSDIACGPADTYFFSPCLVNAITPSGGKDSGGTEVYCSGPGIASLLRLPETALHSALDATTSHASAAALLRHFSPVRHPVTGLLPVAGLFARFTLVRDDASSGAAPSRGAAAGGGGSGSCSGKGPRGNISSSAPPPRVQVTPVYYPPGYDYGAFELASLKVAAMEGGGGGNGNGTDVGRVGSSGGTGSRPHSFRTRADGSLYATTAAALRAGLDVNSDTAVIVTPAVPYPCRAILELCIEEEPQQPQQHSHYHHHQHHQQHLTPVGGPQRFSFYTQPVIQGCSPKELVVLGGKSDSESKGGEGEEGETLRVSGGGFFGAVFADAVARPHADALIARVLKDVEEREEEEARGFAAALAAVAAAPPSFGAPLPPPPPPLPLLSHRVTVGGPSDPCDLLVVYEVHKGGVCLATLDPVRAWVELEYRESRVNLRAAAAAVAEAVMGGVSPSPFPTPTTPSYAAAAGAGGGAGVRSLKRGGSEVPPMYAEEEESVVLGNYDARVCTKAPNVKALMGPPRLPPLPPQGGAGDYASLLTARSGGGGGGGGGGDTGDVTLIPRVSFNMGVEWVTGGCVGGGKGAAAAIVSSSSSAATAAAAAAGTGASVVCRRPELSHATPTVAPLSAVVGARSGLEMTLRGVNFSAGASNFSVRVDHIEGEKEGEEPALSLLGVVESVAFVSPTTLTFTLPGALVSAALEKYFPSHSGHKEGEEGEAPPTPPGELSGEGAVPAPALALAPAPASVATPATDASGAVVAAAPIAHPTPIGHFTLQFTVLAKATGEALPTPTPMRLLLWSPGVGELPPLHLPVDEGKGEEDGSGATDGAAATTHPTSTSDHQVVGVSSSSAVSLITIPLAPPNFNCMDALREEKWVAAAVAVAAEEGAVAAEAGAVGEGETIADSTELATPATTTAASDTVHDTSTQSPPPPPLSSPPSWVSTHVLSGGTLRSGFTSPMAAHVFALPVLPPPVLHEDAHAAAAAAVPAGAAVADAHHSVASSLSPSLPISLPSPILTPTHITVPLPPPSILPPGRYTLSVEFSTPNNGGTSASGGGGAPPPPAFKIPGEIILYSPSTALALSGVTCKKAIPGAECSGECGVLGGVLGYPPPPPPVDPKAAAAAAKTPAAKGAAAGAGGGKGAAAPPSTVKAPTPEKAALAGGGGGGGEGAGSGGHPPPPPPPPTPLPPSPSQVCVKLMGPTDPKTHLSPPPAVLSGVLHGGRSVAFTLPGGDAGAPFVGSSTVALSIDGGHVWGPPFPLAIAKK